MGSKVLMRGTHVLGESAIRAGCRAYFGYPITPQNELPEYMSKAFAKMDDAVFVQAESEIASINMVIGASVAGARAMTSSSSPGISLKQEGISYLAAMELPAVIVNMMRGGPGLGNIAPAQGDYFQAYQRRRTWRLPSHRTRSCLRTRNCGHDPPSVRSCRPLPHTRYDTG